MANCGVCEDIGLVVNDGSNYPWRFEPNMPSKYMAIVLGNTSIGAKYCPNPNCNVLDRLDPAFK